MIFDGGNVSLYTVIVKHGRKKVEEQKNLTLNNAESVKRNREALGYKVEVKKQKRVR